MNDPYLDDPDLPPRPGRSRTFAVAGIAVAALAAFGGLIWYAYNLGSAQPGGTVPTISAQTGPVRREPADPGGQKVEHTDKDVYGVLERSASNKPRVERMLPPPETPMARPPEPLPPIVAVAPPASPPVPPVTASAPPAAPPAPGAQPAATPPGTRPVAAPPPATPPAARPADRAVAAAPLVPSAPPAAAPAAVAPPPAKPATPPAKPGAGQQVASLPPTAEPAKPPEAKPAPEAKPPEAKPAAPKPAAAQPTPKPGTGPVRVQFGAYRSEDEARQTWTKLRGQNGDLLGRLAFMTESVQRADGTVLHRVQGGTLSDAAAAQFLCDQMKARKVDCIVVKR